jgi:hypothetical protein
VPSQMLGAEGPISGWSFRTSQAAKRSLSPIDFSGLRANEKAVSSAEAMAEIRADHVIVGVVRAAAHSNDRSLEGASLTAVMARPHRDTLHAQWEIA